MPYIFMCKNRKCPRRKDCYRYRAVPDPHWQARFEFEHSRCSHFLPLQPNDKVRPMSEIEPKRKGKT